MRLTLLLLALPLFVACTPAPTDVSNNQESSASSSTADAALTVRLEKTTTEDAQGIPHTNVTLHFSGATEETVEVKDVQGELLYVDPKAYGVYAQDNGETIAVLTAWWAGQGEEIILTQLPNPSVISVLRKYGDEQGTCTEPEIVAELPLAGQVSATLEGFGAPTAEQSSIQFCYKS